MLALTRWCYEVKSYLKINQHRVREIAQWIKQWSCKCEDQSSDPQSPSRSQAGMAATSNPRTLEAERQGIPGVGRLARQVGLGDLRVCHYTLSWYSEEWLRKIPSVIPRISIYMSTRMPPHVNMLTHACNSTHTYTCQEKKKVINMFKEDKMSC